MIRKSTRTLVKNKWHQYKKDIVLLKNGEEGEYYYIDHPSSIAVIPILAGGKVIMLKTFRYLFGRHLNQFVLGHTNPSADQKQEARRELEEETGFLANEIIHIGSFTPLSGIANEICRVFVAKKLIKTSVHRNKIKRQVFSVIKNTNLALSRFAFVWKLKKIPNSYQEISSEIKFLKKTVMDKIQ